MWLRRFRADHSGVFLTLCFLGLLLLGYLVGTLLVEEFMTQIILGSASAFIWWMYDQRAWAYPVYAMLLAIVIFFSDDIKSYVLSMMSRYRERGIPESDMTAWEAVNYILYETEEGNGKHWWQVVDMLRYSAQPHANGLPIVVFGVRSSNGQRDKIKPDTFIENVIFVDEIGDSWIGEFPNWSDLTAKKHAHKKYYHVHFWKAQIESRWRRTRTRYNLQRREIIDAFVWLLRDSTRIQDRYDSGFRGVYCIAQPLELELWEEIKPLIKPPTNRLDEMNAVEIGLWLSNNVMRIAKEWGVEVEFTRLASQMSGSVTQLDQG